MRQRLRRLGARLSVSRRLPCGAHALPQKLCPLFPWHRPALSHDQRSHRASAPADDLVRLWRSGLPAPVVQSDLALCPSSAAAPKPRQSLPAVQPPALPATREVFARAGPGQIGSRACNELSSKIPDLEYSRRKAAEKKESDLVDLITSRSTGK